MFGCAQQVLHRAYHFVRFLKDIQINVSHCDIVLCGPHALHLLAPRLGQTLLEGLALLPYLFGAFPIVRTDHRLRAFQQEQHSIAKRHEFFHTVHTQRNETVVDMFLTWVTDSTQAIQHIFAAVSSDMEPCTLFDGSGMRELAQAKSFFASCALERVFFVEQRAVQAFERVHILVYECAGHSVKALAGKGHELALTLGNVGQQQSLPLPKHYVAEFEEIRSRADEIFADALSVMSSRNVEAVPPIRRRCDELKDRISDGYHRLHEQLREGDPSTITVLYVYLNMLQETQDLISNVRKYLRAFAKLCDTDSRIAGPRASMPTPSGTIVSPDRFATIDQRLL